jgi:hypothetical protein
MRVVRHCKKTLDQGVFVQVCKESRAGDPEHCGILHGGRGFLPFASTDQGQLAESIVHCMNCQQTLFAFRRNHEQFDLSRLNEVDVVRRIATKVHVLVPGNAYGRQLERCVMQRFTKSFSEVVCLSLHVRSRANKD